MKPRFILTLFLGLVFILGGIACTSEKTAWDRIQETGTIRIGLDPTYPPFESLEGEEPQGIDVDLTEAIARNLGLKAEYIYFGYDGLYDALATDQVDVLASALVIVPSRLRDFEYSVSYFNAGQVIVSRSDAPIENPSNLQDKTIAVELGAQAHVEALNWQRTFEDLELVTYQSAAEAIDAVVNGEVDGAVVDHISALLSVKKDPQRVIVSEPVTDEPYALVVNEGEDKLLESIDKSLQGLKQRGEIQGILDDWFGG